MYFLFSFNNTLPSPSIKLLSPFHILSNKGPIFTPGSGHHVCVRGGHRGGHLQDHGRVRLRGPGDQPEHGIQSRDPILVSDWPGRQVLEGRRHRLRVLPEVRDTGKFLNSSSILSEDVAFLWSIILKEGC